MFEKSEFLYYLFFALGFVSTSLFGFFYRKKIGLSIKKALLAVVMIYVPSVIWMFLLFWAESGFQTFGGNNIVRVFVWVPLFALPVAKILKVDVRDMLNFIAPLPCAVHGISHYGCIFEGCCYGYPSNVFAIWNPELHEYRFAIQPIEATIAVLVIVATVLYTSQMKFSKTANAYPVMLILFGSTRFFLEFARDNEKLFWGISNLAIHAFIMFIVGIVWLIIATLIQKKKMVQQPAMKKEAE